MPPSSSNPVTYFARTLSRDQRQRFGIKRNDRLSHIYVIGKTGAGKSTLLETMMLQDITRGEGFTLLDPHGDLVERIARAIPAHRRKDLIYFDVSDPDQPYGYNPLKRVAPKNGPLPPRASSKFSTRPGESGPGASAWSISCATPCCSCSTSPRRRWPTS